MRENEITARTDFPPRGKDWKCWKSFVARERRAKNGENGLSLVSEMQKMRKTAFRSQATSKKTGKVELRGIPKGWNSEKQCFGMPRRVVFGENEPSGSPEARKIWKKGPRDAPKRPNVIFPSAKCWLKAENAGCWLNMIALHITKTPLQLLS